jgi:hypothetical protein
LRGKGRVVRRLGFGRSVFAFRLLRGWCSLLRGEVEMGIFGEAVRVVCGGNVGLELIPAIGELERRKICMS